MLFYREPLGNESTQIHQIINIKRLWKENLSKLGVIYFQNDNRIMSGSMFGAVAIEQSSSRFHNYRWTFISNQNFVEKYFIIWISRHSRIRLKPIARLAKVVLIGQKKIVRIQICIFGIGCWICQTIYLTRSWHQTTNPESSNPDFFSYQNECSDFERI